MRKILFLLLILISINGYSQQCYFAINKTDKATGRKSLLTRSENINKTFNSRYYFSTSLAYADSNLMLCLQLTGAGTNISIEKGTELTLSLADGTKLALFADDNYQSSSSTAPGGGFISRISPFYKISRDDLEKIAKAGIIEIKMKTHTSNFESRVTERDNKRINTLVTCLLKNI